MYMLQIPIKYVKHNFGMIVLGAYNVVFEN